MTLTRGCVLNANWNHYTSIFFNTLICQEQLQQELLDAKKMIEKLAAQLASQKPSPVGETKPDGKSSGSEPLPSSCYKEPNPDRPNQPVAPPAEAPEKDKKTKPEGADKPEKAGRSQRGLGKTWEDREFHCIFTTTDILRCPIVWVDITSYIY